MSYTVKPMTAAKISNKMLQILAPGAPEIPEGDPVLNEYWVQLAEDEYTLAPSESALLELYIFTGEKDEAGFAPIAPRP